MHTAVRIKGSLVHTGLVSHEPAKRLVVFVHGFLGRASATWGRFARVPPHSSWWAESDLLFVGYRSFFDSIAGTADRLRGELGDFYPIPHPQLVFVGGVPARSDLDRPYEDLVLVGHSLGGVVIRVAVADSATAVANPTPGSTLTSELALLESAVRLFSPATGGYLGAGAVGAAQGLLGQVLDIPLGWSASYRQLQSGSRLLTDTQQRTERHARRLNYAGLKASHLWANPENIVDRVQYRHDHVGDSALGRNHLTVCKPNSDYILPWQFVETGRAR